MRALRIAVLLVPFLILAATTTSAQTSDERQALRDEVAQLFKGGKYAEALTAQRKLTASIEKAETADTGAPAKWSAESLGHLAWYALFARDYAEALAASKRAHALAPELLWIETNRAHALLLMRQTAQARAIYRAHKGKRVFEGYAKVWEDAIADDFEEMRGAGIVHLAFADILSQLGITGAHLRLSKEIATAGKQIEQLWEAGKYADAMAVAQKNAELVRQRFGEERSEFAAASTWLGLIKEKLDGPAQAEPFHTHALSIYEKALASDRPEISTALKNLAELYKGLGRASEAEPLSRRARAIDELAARRASYGPGTST
jgi:dihydrodipicolinate synthase/N-acetylneuraminate lyase